MKNKITLMLIGFSLSLFSQNITKEELHQKLTTSTCECLDGKEINAENYEVKLGLCLLTAVSKDKADVKKHYGDNYMKSMEILGEAIGELMVTSCPDKLSFIFNEEFLDKYMNEEETDASEDYMTDEYSSDVSVKGIFEQKRVDGFLYVTLKNDDGKKYEFVLINNFDNAYLITDNVLKKGAKIIVNYFDGEIYDAKNQKFIYCKIISDITKL